MNWVSLAAWKGAVLGPVEVVDSIDSTNLEMLRRFENRAGDQTGRVLVARHQSAGRGRLGRTWLTPSDTAVALSACLSLDPGIPAAAVTMCAAVSVLDLLGLLRVEGARLKWPNDVLIGDRKLCGLLAESRSNPGAGRVAILGIGLNVLGRVEQLPPEIRSLATTLEEVGRSEHPAEIAARLLQVLDVHWQTIRAGRLKDCTAKWRVGLGIDGRNVELTTPDRILRGRVLDLEPDGTFVIESIGQGPVERVPGGHVLRLRTL